MKIAHDVVDCVKSMSPILCCSETHLCEFSWEHHCLGHLTTLQDFICAPSDSKPGRCPFCLGNESFPSSRRYAPFNSLLALWAHIRADHPAPSDARLRNCPHPLCQQDLCSNDQLEEHFQVIHGMTRQETLPKCSKRTRGSGASDGATPKRQKILTDVLANTDDLTNDAVAE